MRVRNGLQNKAKIQNETRLLFQSALPRDSGEEALGVFTHKVLAYLVKPSEAHVRTVATCESWDHSQEQRDTKGNRDENIFDWYQTRLEDTLAAQGRQRAGREREQRNLQPRDRREEDAEDERADGRGDRVQVQERAVLEDTQSPSAGGEEITCDVS